jgi:hypothetical protein
MKKLAAILTLVAALAPIPTLAHPLDGVRDLVTREKNYSRIDEAACRGWGRHCPPGYVWTCGPNRCWCRPCW